MFSSAFNLNLLWHSHLKQISPFLTQRFPLQFMITLSFNFNYLILLLRHSKQRLAERCRLRASFMFWTKQRSFLPRIIFSPLHHHQWLCNYKKHFPCFHGTWYFSKQSFSTYPSPFLCLFKKLLCRFPCLRCARRYSCVQFFMRNYFHPKSFSIYVFGNVLNRIIRGKCSSS